MIERKIDSYIEHYYRHTDKALLVDGARQVGKTYSIRRFGHSNFKSFIEINFVNMPEAVSIFKNAASGDDLLLRLSAFTDQPLIKGKTLIFFDEVQKCPEIVTAMKFLVDEGSYRYIMSGSLLGVELKSLSSAPVGYIDIKSMFPIDFEEFLDALGVARRIVDQLRECFTDRKPVDEVIHGRLMQLFRLYLVVGGMPAAVQTYLDTNNLQEVMAEQRAIIRLYQLDISQYDPDDKLYLDDIFDLIPSELNAKNKRFILKDMNENLKFGRYESSFLWMSHAGVALPTYNVEEPVPPLKLARSRNLFKLFQNDVGLLACQYAAGLQLRILNGEKNINFGSVFENFVAEELHAHGFELYYFNSKKQGELDFIFEQNGYTVPVEVKSGKDYDRHNALTHVMADEQYGIPMAYVLCNGNVRVKGKLVYLPVYMTMFLQKEQSSPLTYKADLSGLRK
ncbi:MAG: AAA family ATPase [Prevotella sp.]|jgi:predicted AAA+ superfamily ATPase|nr:AAA family ATPase [Prevotella sp.]